MGLQQVPEHVRSRWPGPPVAPDEGDGDNEGMPPVPPPPSGTLEPRVAKLEAGVEALVRDVSDLRSEMRSLRGDMSKLRDDQRGDFRLTWGALIAVALGLAGLMAKGFHWL